MKWYELAVNPQVILDWYTEVPPLHMIYLQAVRLYEENARAMLRIDIATLPDKTPPQWKPEWCNTVALQLDFLDIESIQITRWSTINRTDIHIEQITNGWIEMQAASDSSNIELVAHSFKIAPVRCYRRDDF